ELRLFLFPPMAYARNPARHASAYGKFTMKIALPKLSSDAAAGKRRKTGPEAPVGHRPSALPQVLRKAAQPRRTQGPAEVARKLFTSPREPKGRATRRARSGAARGPKARARTRKSRRPRGRSRRPRGAA